MPQGDKRITLDEVSLREALKMLRDFVEPKRSHPGLSASNARGLQLFIGAAGRFATHALV